MDGIRSTRCNKYVLRMNSYMAAREHNNLGFQQEAAVVISIAKLTSSHSRRDGWAGTTPRVPGFPSFQMTDASAADYANPPMRPLRKSLRRPCAPLFHFGFQFKPNQHTGGTNAGLDSPLAFSALIPCSSSIFAAYGVQSLMFDC